MAIDLVHLCDARFVLRDPVTLPDTPAGTRMIFEVEHAEFEGERLKGSHSCRTSADWVTFGPGGVATLDVRLTLETHDGALILATYRGRVAGGVVYAAPLYDTGDERYLWLNSIQAVAKGTLDGNLLTYEIYEVR